MQNVVGKKISVAVFKSIEPSGMSGFETIDQKHWEKMDNYVRISEYVEVEFPQLQDEIVIDKYIEALDRSERAVRLEFQKRLDEIAGQRANLLALTHKPA
jgi:hypothetical protein